ncbi:hypothetical protein MWR57_12130 [Desulfovibrionaceae bacterium CB1MN]|uniref:hypothetical protein n=1 Tax=Hydrosulfovibrio ferrireducens TaxID=2934181 RepID=UPI003ABA945B
MAISLSLVGGELFYPRNGHLHNPFYTLHEGLVHNELMLTVPDGAALPMGIAIRFIRGMLDLYHESTPGITVKSFLDEEAKQVADKIAPRCYYAGCGTDDGWPTAK